MKTERETDIEIIKNLVEKLNVASKAYYRTGRTIMTDKEYDASLEKLKEYERKTNYILSNSPTVNVGYENVDDIEKVEHEHLMLSLDKAHTEKEIIDFTGLKDVLAMFKMDGLTVSATYEDGNLVRLETRGNGVTGNDILFHARSFMNLPMKIEKKERYVVDGEAIINFSNFLLINNILSEKEKYKNPRNLAAGTLNLHDANVSKERYLEFVLWDVIEGGRDNNSLNENLIEASDLGFTVVPYKYMKATEVKQCNTLKEYMDYMRKNAKEIGYPIDGIVFKFDDIEYGKLLGKTSKFFNNAIAYKFEDDRYETKLIGVDWTMGKTGVITPTIITEPVEIDGTIVERASVHNISIFKQLHFTKGCTCYLYKANMIIPQCDGTEDDGEEELEIPCVCPICGSKTNIALSHETEILLCTNEKCKGKLLGKLKHFVSKDAINIDGMSEKTLQKMIDIGLVECFNDLYKLSLSNNILCKQNGLGKKSVDTMLQNIEKSRLTTLDRFIYSISIPSVGQSASKTIAKYFHNDFNEWCKTWDERSFDYTVLDDFGDVMNSNINGFIKQNRNMLENLAKEFVFIKSEEKNTSDLEHQVFVVTGSLNNFSNRNELKAKIEAMGGRVSDSVSKNTTYLINNDKESNSSKNKKAKQLGVNIINEEEFLSLFSIITN